MLFEGKRFLIVDDEPDLRDMIAGELELEKAKVFEAENVKSALKILESQPVDIILSDVRMPGGSGLELLKSLNRRADFTPIFIIITAYSDIPKEVLYDQGVDAVFPKPFDLKILLKAIIKYQIPLENRFETQIIKNNVSGTLDIMETATKPIFFGRNGICIETPSDSFITGSILDFNITLKNKKEIHGQGMVMWSETLQEVQGNNDLNAIGFEFTYLHPKYKENCLEILRSLVHEKSAIPGIKNLLRS